jgi:hypothetical protein
MSKKKQSQSRGRTGAQKQPAAANSLPKLLDETPLSLGGLAKRAGVHRNTARAWRAGVLPQPEQRRALVRAVKKHAQMLLKLAGDVEEQGEKWDIARQRFTDWGPDTVKVLSAPKRRGRDVRARKGTNRRREG